MKKALVGICVIGVLGLGSIGMAYADPSTKDARVDAALKELEMKYEVDSDGDAKLGIGLGDGRSQLLFVNANTSNVGNESFREVWTVGLLSDKPISGDVARELLERNHNYKVGAWSLVKFGDKYAAVFTAQIPANADAKLLRASMAAVAISADEVEKEKTGKDDR